MIPNTFIEFYGDQTRWFLGEVVDIYDSLYLGRIRVKIFGVHDQIKDVDLPWAQTVVPITQGGTQGYGNNIGIQEGAQVFGVFLDGPSSQMPLVLGSIPRVEDQDFPRRTTNNLAWETSGEERHHEIPSPLLDNISINNQSVNLRQKVKYPHNKVYETEGVEGKTGHIKEYDDTAGYERIHERHSSGTFYQMGPSGELVTNVEQNEYRKVEGQRITEIGTKIDSDDSDDNNYFTEETVVHGKRVTTIDSDETLLVLGDKYTSVFGNDELYVTGDVNITVIGSAKVDVTENVNVVSKTSIDLTAPEVTVRGSTIKLNS